MSDTANSASPGPASPGTPADIEGNAVLQCHEMVAEALQVSTGESMAVQEEATTIENLAKSYQQYVEQFTAQAEQAHKDLLSGFATELDTWTKAVEAAQADLQAQMHAGADATAGDPAPGAMSEVSAPSAPHTHLVKAMLDKASEIKGEIKDGVEKATTGKTTTTKTSQTSSQASSQASSKTSSGSASSNSDDES